MGLVSPITALYMGPVAVYMYWKALPVMEKNPMTPQMKALQERLKDKPPTLFQNILAGYHCGAGCSIGDLIAESIVPTLGLIFAGEFGSKLILDFVFAYILGIAFQYFTIVPMRGLSFGKGIAAAARADTISITLFEVGMYAWMAITYFLLFPSPHLDPGLAVFWFMMQRHDRGNRDRGSRQRMADSQRMEGENAADRSRSDESATSPVNPPSPHGNLAKREAYSGSHRMRVDSGSSGRRHRLAKPDAAVLSVNPRPMTIRQSLRTSIAAAQ